MFMGISVVLKLYHNLEGIFSKKKANELLVSSQIVKPEGSFSLKQLGQRALPPVWVNLARSS